MRVESREVTARARRDPAAEGRELKRLREVAERQAVLAQLRLEHRSARAGLDARRQRGTIDLEHAVDRRDVDRHHPREAPPVDARLDAADRARSPAERDHRRARAECPLEHRLELGLVPWAGHDVRRLVELAAERPDDVAV